MQILCSSAVPSDSFLSIFISTYAPYMHKKLTFKQQKSRHNDGFLITKAIIKRGGSPRE